MHSQEADLQLVHQSPMCSYPVLSCPDFNKPFVVQTDVPEQEVGKVLAKVGNDGNRLSRHLEFILKKQALLFSDQLKDHNPRLYRCSLVLQP